MISSDTRKYFDRLAVVLRNGTDNEILHELKKCPTKLSDQHVLFQNQGAAIDALQFSLLRSHRSNIWPKLLNIGLFPNTLVPPKHLRLYFDHDNNNGNAESSHSPTTTAGSRTPDDDGLQISGLQWEKSPPHSPNVQMLEPNSIIDTDLSTLREGGCLTLLEIASQLSQEYVFISLVECIRNHGFEDMKIDDAVHYACDAGSVEMLSHTLKIGGDPNCIRGGYFPIHVAVESSREPTVKVRLLIQNGADLNAICPNLDGATALLIATQRNDVQLVQLLLERGADPNIMAPALGLPTPLFHSVYWGQEILTHLICDLGNPDLSICNQSGESIFKTSENVLLFARAKKPGHISRLPLPKTSIEVCCRIRNILDACQDKQRLSDSRPVDDSKLSHQASSSDSLCACCEQNLEQRRIIHQAFQASECSSNQSLLSNSRSEEQQWGVLCLGPFSYKVDLSY